MISLIAEHCCHTYIIITETLLSQRHCSYRDTLVTLSQDDVATQTLLSWILSQRHYYHSHLVITETVLSQRHCYHSHFVVTETLLSQKMYYHRDLFITSGTLSLKHYYRRGIITEALLQRHYHRGIIITEMPCALWVMLTFWQLFQGGLTWYGKQMCCLDGEPADKLTVAALAE